MRRFRTTIFPLFLMLTTPLAIVLLWMICSLYNGSISLFATHFDLKQVLALWPLPTWAAAKTIAIFAAVEALLMVALPGNKHLGPVTPTGNRPTYKLNGVAAFCVTHALFCLGAFQFHLFDASAIYDHFGELLMTINVFALAFCLFLYFKGSYFPSSSDAGRSGNFIWDYYWGVELHPHFGKFNVKQFTNCRVGMMGWSVLTLAFLAKQQAVIGHISTSMWVTFILQQVYFFKFFWWESGYFASLDIMHDRLGYYICWGVLCWIPGVYALVSQYMVMHPIELPLWYAAAVTALGLFAIWANYDADAQRQRVRETGGKTTVWGNKPELLVAHYRTSDGQERENLLLANGWWGLARHFHYVPEITLSLAWTLPALFDNLLPYFYVIFLTILLTDRAGRDEIRCRNKYGEDWKLYCARVRWRIVPGLY